MKLDRHDLRFALIRLPKALLELMKTEEWQAKIFVGGGYLRSIVAREPINDIDIFVSTKKDAELLAFKLCRDKDDVITTENAYTVKGKTTLQIIHRWLFEKPEDVALSFDFTICCAVFYYTAEKKWDSFCDDRFYMDLAAKRLVYRKPKRNEDAGGSMLRVLKYYQRGYRIPLDSLGAVIARLNTGVTPTHETATEDGYAYVVTGLLRVVDPSIDPLHDAHLPSLNQTKGEIIHNEDF